MKSKSWIIWILLTILLMLGELLALNAHFKAKLEGLKPQVDTLVIRDTLTFEKPVEIETRILVTDSIFIPIIDTIRIQDSIFVQVAREQKVYADSSYRAVVSGYLPSLDSISVFNKTLVVEKIYKEKTDPKISIGVNAGYGVSVYNGLVRTQPYIGIGISYNFLSL